VAAAAVSRWHRIIVPASVALGLGYLAGMAWSGAQFQQRQFVAFEAKGLLKTPPEQVRRVELARADERISLLRRGENGWSTLAGAEIDPQVAKRISLAVEMMHNAAPAREIAPDEIAGTEPAAFGLDAPRVTARFYESGADPVLAVHFGAGNPDGFMQYLRIDGDEHLYLMSRFVGEAWSGALDGSVQR
jgi:hypothetical protein